MTQAGQGAGQGQERRDQWGAKEGIGGNGNLEKKLNIPSKTLHRIMSVLSENMHDALTLFIFLGPNAIAKDVNLKDAQA